jgi:hypothetical protein
MLGEVERVFVCQRCFSMDVRPGPCPQDGMMRVECHLGDLDNPCRRPPMDESGRILNRAPLWWVLQSAPYLRDHVRR